MDGLRYTFYYTPEMAVTSITEITEDKRALNALFRDGIFTVDQLTDKWTELGTMKNIGRLTTAKVKKSFWLWYMGKIKGTPTWPKFIDSMQRRVEVEEVKA